MQENDTTLNSRIKEIEVLNKTIQKDLEEKKALLFQNEIQLTKLQLVVKATKIGLWDTEHLSKEPFDVNKTFIWSQDFRQLLGFENEEDFPNVLGSWSERIHPHDKQRVFDAVQEHLSDTTGKKMLDVEYRMKKKDGVYAYFKTMGTTMRDKDGRPSRVVGSQLDITETKNLIQEAQNRREEAERANKAKSSFLSTMSHEIRTPMNAILGIAEIELMDESLPKNIRAAFEKIFVSGDMLMGIINDILDLSKIEAGKMELMYDKYSIENLVYDVAQLNMMRIGSKPISFELDISEQICTHLFGDELRIKQILNNLLSNAFKYSDHGKVVLSLYETDKTENNTTLVIKVSDTGQGMTKEQVAHLFDEYSQFNQEANRLTEGTGLGMSITNNLIRLMGGTISVVSEPQKGSIFTVNLPQKRISGASAIGKTVAQNLRGFNAKTGYQMKKMQIAREPMPYGSVLVVDDVDTNIHVAKGLLTPYEIEIDSTDSGFGAIEKIQNNNTYDIIFIDHMMPKMDGVEATKKIRAMGYKQPIVALTANAVIGQLNIFLENGFDDFISKPIDIRLLNVVLNKYIRDKQPPEIIEAAKKRKPNTNQTNIPIIEIPGIDTKKAMEQFGESYTKILQSYSANTAKTIEKLTGITKNKLQTDIDTYEMAFHSIKGSSYGICADNIGALAAELEKAAKTQDYKYINDRIEPFITATNKLLTDIKCALPQELNEKPTKDKLDKTLLSDLAQACNMFDMGEVDIIMEQLNKYKYEKDDELLQWLQKNVELVNFDEIAKRLSN